MPVEGRIDSAFPISDATPPCGNCQRSKAPCPYQVVRHLDAGFLTMQARSKMAGSLRALHQDRGAWNGGTVQTLGSDPGAPLPAPWPGPGAAHRLPTEGAPSAPRILPP